MTDTPNRFPTVPPSERPFLLRVAQSPGLRPRLELYAKESGRSLQSATLFLIDQHLTALGYPPAADDRPERPIGGGPHDARDARMYVLVALEGYADEYEVDRIVCDLRDRCGGWAFHEISQADFWRTVARHAK